jgi:hypothetical protein
MMSSFRDYVCRDRNRIEGWFGRIDSQIFFELLNYQNASGIDGALAEIGVHHGKSFIALCLSVSGTQKAYAIDLFEDQQKNLDSSGKGDREIFRSNLARFGISEEKVVIDARGSDEVAPEDIRGAVGAVRFFSIDGGHWRDIARSDLQLAVSVLAEGGVIALDDFMRPEWPDVSFGFFDWFEGSDRQIVPLAIGFNKLYLCHHGHVARYRSCLEKSDFLRFFLNKHYEFCGVRVPVFQAFQLPEWGLLRRLFEYLKLYHPDAYVTLRKLMRK